MVKGNPVIAVLCADLGADFLISGFLFYLVFVFRTGFQLGFLDHNLDFCEQRKRFHSCRAPRQYLEYTNGPTFHFQFSILSKIDLAEKYIQLRFLTTAQDKC